MVYFIVIGNWELGIGLDINDQCFLKDTIPYLIPMQEIDNHHDCYAIHENTFPDPKDDFVCAPPDDKFCRCGI